jgi:hypothetical protein
MRHLLSTILTLTFFATYGQVPKDTTNKIRKLNIAMVTTSTVVLQKGIINSELSSNFFILYDEKGRPTENRFKNLNDKKLTVYKFQYGSCNEYKKWEWLEYNNDKIDTIQIQNVTFYKNCLMESIVWTDSTKTITDTRNISYDNKGRLAKEVNKNSKGEITAFVYYSYPDSFTVDKKGFFGDSSFWYHSREYFDLKGNTLYTSSFNKDNIETIDNGKTKYNYEDNKITETLSYDLQGNIIAKTTFVYNSDGLLERTISKSLITGEDSETISTNRYIKRN